MLYRVATILADPFLVILLLALIATANLWRRRSEGRQRLLLASLALVGLVVCCMPVTGRLALGSLEWQVPSEDVRPGRDDAEAIVVLGGYLLPPDPDAGRPRALLGPDSLYRCFHAAEVYRRIGPCPILVSGGKVEPDRPGPPLATVMREFLITQGVDPDDLISEGRSRSTYENAVQCRRLLANLDISEIILVTEALHMPRALACFRKQGLHAFPDPCNRRAFFETDILSLILPNPSAAMDWRQSAHEWLGMAWYWLRGRIGGTALLRPGRSGAGELGAGQQRRGVHEQRVTNAAVASRPDNPVNAGPEAAVLERLAVPLQSSEGRQPVSSSQPGVTPKRLLGVTPLRPNWHRLREPIKAGWFAHKEQTGLNTVASTVGTEVRTVVRSVLREKHHNQSQIDLISAPACIIVARCWTSSCPGMTTTDHSVRGRPAVEDWSVSDGAKLSKGRDLDSMGRSHAWPRPPRRCAGCSTGSANARSGRPSFMGSPLPPPRTFPGRLRLSDRSRAQPGSLTKPVAEGTQGKGPVMQSAPKPMEG